MKHNCKTNKIQIILSVLFMAIAFFTSCSIADDDTPFNNAENNSKLSSGVIKLSVDLDENTIARSVRENKTSRSAMPSTFPTSASSKLVFAGAIHSNTETLTASMLKIAETSASTAENKLNIELPFEISETVRENYILDIYAYANGTTPPPLR